LEDFKNSLLESNGLWNLGVEEINHTVEASLKKLSSKGSFKKF
jgi:hypothetical protein